MKPVPPQELRGGIGDKPLDTQQKRNLARQARLEYKRRQEAKKAKINRENFVDTVRKVRKSKSN